MGQISNRFFVTSIKDGTVVSAVLYSDKSLTQLVNPNTGESQPSWTVAENQPTVQCVVRAGATTKTPAEWDWYLNDVLIEFSSKTTGQASTNFGGIFEWRTVTVDGVSCPALKIKGNIITVFNRDNDVLSCRGAVEFNGANISYEVSTTIRMSTLSGSGYFGWIDGDSYVTAQSGADGTATMGAHLTTANGDVANFRTRWYLELDVQPSGWPKTVTASNGVATATITGAEITDYVVVRCDFYASSDTGYANKLFSAYWDVDDRQDDEQMYIASYVISGVRGGLDVSLRTGQNAQFVAWIGSSSDQTKVDTRYTSFKARLMNSEGITITDLTGSGVITGSGSLVITDGYVNITKASGITTPVTAAKAGVITIPSTYVDTQGGRITGIIVAQ